jgi:hypothetical protein
MHSCAVQETEDGLPRRSARVAAQGNRRVSNPEVQAQNVLLKKWKESHSPDANALQAYNEMYNSLVGLSKRKAIRALFMASAWSPWSVRWTWHLDGHVHRWVASPLFNG